MGREVLRLPSDQRLTLVTDIHLGDGTYTDLFGRKDREFLDLLNHADGSSDRLIVMGDCFDLLQASSMRHILRAHGEIANRFQRFARQGRLVFLRGNHDFMADTVRTFPGARITDFVRVGGEVRIEHGDRFDAWGNHETATAGRFHNFLERLTRSHWRIPLREHDDWGNRMAHWTAHKLMVSLRLVQRLLVWNGHKRKARKIRRFLRYWSRTVWGDFSELFHRVRQGLPRWRKIRVLVCGHSHLPGDVRMGEKRYINVGSWARDNTQFCDYDGKDFWLKEWRTGRPIGDENYRFLIDHPRLPSYEQWFERHHRGMLSFRI